MENRGEGAVRCYNDDAGRNLSRAVRRVQFERVALLNPISRKRISLLVPLAALALVIVLAGAARYRLLDVPLERDEGEYACAGRMILHEGTPYVDLYNMKLPGIYAVYAVILKLFGETARGIHLGLLFANALTVLFVYLLGRRFLSSLAALAGAANFALLSISPAVQGMFANAEHFVLLFALPGLLVLTAAVESNRKRTILAAGVLLGCAFIVKQHAVAFVVLGAWLLARGRPGEEPTGPSIENHGAGTALLRRRTIDVLVFSAAVLGVYGTVCAIFAAAGAFGNFWHWTVEYASRYVSQVPLSEGPGRFSKAFGFLFRAAPILWVEVIAGTALLLLRAWPGRRAGTLFWFAAASLAATAPGLYFRPHYFILLLPAATIVSGGAVEALFRALQRRTGRPVASLAAATAGGIAVIALLLTIFAQRDFLFRLTPEQVCRRVFGLNPFIESVEIAAEIDRLTAPGEPIAVIGSEPQIYFYSKRPAATGYIYMYPMMEKHPFALEMQMEMIREIEAARPAVLIYVRNVYSWGITPDSRTEILDWFGAYKDANYHLAGLVSQYPTYSECNWGPDVPWPPESPAWIALLKRND